MNYIELVNRFWTSHNAHSFNVTDIALYFYLLDVFNICQWTNQIKRNNRKVETDLGISYKTLVNSRNRLQQAEVLYFKSKNGNANVSYSLGKFTEVEGEVGGEVGDEVRARSGKSKDKHKLNKTFKIKEREVFVSEMYYSVLSEMQNDAIWFEPLCMNTQTSPKQFQEKLIEFFVLRTNEGLVEVPILQDCKQHFANWLRTDKEKHKKGGNNVVQSQQAVNTAVKLHPRLQQS